MKQQVAKTISVFSLIVMLSVGVSNVRAFPVCTTCNPRIMMSAPTQGIKLTTGQAMIPTSAPDVAVAQPESEVSLSVLFWVRLGVFFASLI